MVITNCDKATPPTCTAKLGTTIQHICVMSTKLSNKWDSFLVYTARGSRSADPGLAALLPVALALALLAEGTVASKLTALCTQGVGLAS